GMAPAPAQSLSQTPQHLQIAAHRGYSGIAPENTLAAFQAAVQYNADAIEFDIHMTRDGVPVIMHDDTVDRTTNGKGKVKDKSLAELKKLNAGHKQQIPTLQETLQAAQGRILYSEIKGDCTPVDIEKIVRTIVENGYEDRDIMLAFNYQNLLSTRRYSKHMTLGFLTADRDTFQQALNMAYQDGNAVILANATLLLKNPHLITQARQKGIDIGAWTVNSLDDARQLQRLGVKRIITDKLVVQLRQ
ncbi:MAG: glycerophosphodiester phosphodiesterase family protein, partial [Tumebacillaceae bacterium]